MSDYERILSFWFGELDELGQADSEHASRWWRKDPAFDDTIREQFIGDHEAIVAGQRKDWLEVPRGRLATIIVLDQFSRNVFRGKPQMFASDAQALQVALEGIAASADRKLRLDERIFFYMPLMHSEKLVVQEHCVDQFSRLKDETEGTGRDRAASNLEFAIRHRDIVASYGRFPHRNSIVDRPSTAAELEFLKQAGSAF